MKFALIGIVLLILAGAARADLVGQHAGARQLLLSGDGVIALTVGGDATRVWDVSARRELAVLPCRVMAVSGDGSRVLGRSRTASTISYAFWRRVGAGWQRGTVMTDHGDNLPLLDAVFDGDVATVLWLGRIERFATDGTRAASREYDEGDRLRLGAPKTSPPVGALSRDGKRILLWDRGWARVCDATSGRRLTPLYEPKEVIGNNRIYQFSPDGQFVLQTLNYVGDGGYLADEGPPILTQLAIFDARTGASLRSFEDVGSFNFPFWPGDNGGSLLFQVRASPTQWKLDRRDARSGAVLPSELSKPGPAERWLWNLTFARDGVTMVALDESGDIWAEQSR